VPHSETWTAPDAVTGRSASAEPMRIERDRRYRALVVGLLLVVAASLSYVVLASYKADPDAFWHLATGRYILAHHTVPSTDVFSWYGIQHHLSWMPQAWLFDVLAYAVWLLGGFRLLYVVTALAAASVAGLVYWLFALRSGNRLLAVAVAAIAAVGIMPFVAPRPQMLTYPLLLALALLLEHRKWWWAVPVVLLGVNLHGPLYPMYLLVVAYYTLPKRWPVLAACAAVVVATPAGLALIPYPFLSFLSGTSRIQEFAHVAPIEWPVYLVALLLVLVLLDRRSMPAKELLGLLALVVLSLAALRHMVFMFVLALPLAAPYLELPSERRSRAGDSSRSAPGSIGVDAAVPVRPASGGRAMPVLDRLLVAMLVIGAAATTVRAAIQPVDATRGYPVQASQYLQAHGITRYFNEWGDGGFLIFRGMQPLVDGRWDPFFSYPGRSDVTVGSEYIRAWSLETDCRPFLARNGITHLLIHQSSALSMVLEQSASFRAVYRDAIYVVYERVAGASSVQ
jgi:MFS family permease